VNDDKTKALIEDLRLNHEYCPKEVILKAADVIEELTRLLRPPTKIVGPNLEGILNAAGFYRKPPPACAHVDKIIKGSLVHCAKCDFCFGVD
jgi:hypothetical protein